MPSHPLGSRKESPSCRRSMERSPTMLPLENNASPGRTAAPPETALRSRSSVSPGENLQQPVVDISLGRLRQGVEGLRVDEVAARIAERPRLQVEVPQRTSFGVANSARGKLLRK